jgi:hypothetical protein
MVFDQMTSGMQDEEDWKPLPLTAFISVDHY